MRRCKDCKDEEYCKGYANAFGENDPVTEEHELCHGYARKKQSDEITVVKADIRRLKRRRRYLQHRYRMSNSNMYIQGVVDAIATFEKYKANIERKL
jgi:DNA integrity scanning protein DisA with diadenylate cyclase activity